MRRLIRRAFDPRTGPSLSSLQFQFSLVPDLQLQLAMKVYSLVRQGIEFVEVEVEITLLRGLPAVHVLGLPDQGVKESIPRIKSAILNQGFDWPKAQQILINLRPTHIKKSSLGLDLAFAMGILAATGQIPDDRVKESLLFYGELDLTGKVLPPLDHLQLPLELRRRVVGATADVAWMISELHQLRESLRPGQVESKAMTWQRPPLAQHSFGDLAAEQLLIIAAGEHATMVAGPQGTGKSTWVEALYGLLPDPQPEQWQEAQRWADLQGISLSWRPFIAPHHTTTNLAMLGGGFPPVPGELTRAHGGMLFLDEYLEFLPRVQEGLREPLEKGEIRISRRGVSRTFPASFQMVAATNLCPCGRLTPGRSNQACSRSLKSCHSHLHRLNGPMLDRFDLLVFSHQWQGPRRQSCEALKEKVDLATATRLDRGQEVANGRLPGREVEALLPSRLQRFLPSSFSSERRRRALLRVARTLADLAGSQGLEIEHISRAMELTINPFNELERIYS